MIKHFVLIAWRNFRRRKTLSLIQLLCLSVGLAAFILVARYVQYEKDWDKFNENYDRIYRAQAYKANDRMDDWNQLPVPTANYLKENIPEIENAIVLREIWKEFLSPNDASVYMERDGFLAPSDVFEIFSFTLLRGDKNTVLDAPNSIVLSEKMAKKYFPGTDAMGKTILDNQKNELLVTGIMEDIPEQSHIKADYFRSNARLLEEYGSNWYNNSYRTFVLLKPGVTVTSISEKIKDIINIHDPNARRILYLNPLSTLHLKEGPRDDRGSVVYFFIFIGVLTLLLSSVSFMNLTTSFSTLRSVEIGVRKATGSSKNYIRWQFITEAIVVAFLAFVVGLLLAYLLLPFFNHVVNRNIALELFSEPKFPLFLVAVVITTGLFAGAYPAFVVSAFKPVRVLKGKAPHQKGKISGLRGMVYLQFILSVVLITSSLWIYKQVDYMKTKDLGFDKTNLLSCNLPVQETNVNYQTLRQEILSNPGVEDMAISLNSPLQSNWGCQVIPEGGDPENPIFTRWNKGCNNYLSTMSINLKEGRNFSKEFSADQFSCIINETAAQAYGWENPIGKTLEMNGTRTVIGVVKDFNSDDVHNPILPYLLLLNEEDMTASNDLTFKVHPATLESSLDHINSVMEKHFPNILFEVNGYDQATFRLALQLWTNVKDTFAFFTIMAVLIAAMGLFGLVVFASQRRVKEIGIRKVQGARAEQILPLITKQFVILVIAANIIAFPLGKTIENITPGNFKYQFTIWDLGIVLGISVLVTIVSSGYQAIKASRLNPVEALRYE